ncbi:MAG: flippase [Nitrospinae bacterium]|nr:flippase [Nitrospinota bacterium]
MTHRKSFGSYIWAKLEGRNQLKKVLANSGWLFADKLIRMCVGLAVGVWIARYLGVKQFGQLNFAIAFASLFTALATLGLDQIVIRELVRHPDQKNEILGSAFALKLMGGLVAFAVVNATIWMVRPTDFLTHWLVGIIAAGMIFQAFDAIDLWFQSQVKSKFTVYAKSTAFLILSAVKVGLILYGAGLMAFAWTGLAEVVVGALGLMVAFKSVGSSFGSLEIHWPRMLQLLKESWPLLLSGLAITFYMRIDQVMLGEMLGEHDVGIYSAALRLSEVWYVIPMVIVSSVMPSFTEARAHSEELYYQRLQKLFTYLVRIAYLVAIPMTIIATPLITLLFGTQYSSAGPVLAVHIWAALFVFLGVARGIYSINEGLNIPVMFGTISGAILNILLNIILIPRYGALGAAIATIFSYGFSDVVFYRFIPSYRKIYKMMLSALTFGIVKAK